MPNDSWGGHKPSLTYLRILGCSVEASIYNSDEQKLDHRMVNYYVIRYL